ncbi:hypothetical protein [Halotalea alkalilenta]|uniref:hypothetical protein n=1 Tax=Halotalea alkalilenta TaxID=376489 RepID=UPI0012DD5FBE|nr:hypothetical protein [Halotalea alkalilenta]
MEPSYAMDLYRGEAKDQGWNMINWINENSGALLVINGIATLCVWLFYAQLLYQNFARQRRPRILINRSRSRNLDSICLLSNMSSEKIFIEYILVTLHSEKGCVTADIAEFELPSDKEDDLSLENETRQGPLESGQTKRIGTYRALYERVLRENDGIISTYKNAQDLLFDRIEIRVIAIYSSEDRPVGAQRVFILPSEEGGELLPESFDTKRFSSPWERLTVKKWIRSVAHRERRKSPRRHGSSRLELKEHVDES